MRHTTFIARLTEMAAGEPALAALFLGGSFGSGTDDAYSDIDFLAIAPAEAHARIAAHWRKGLEALAPVVFWNERGGRAILLNAITEDWLRVDLLIATAAHLAGRAKEGLEPLVDRDALFAGLPDALPPARPDAEKIGYLIHEFIRVLGLLAVGLGRGELVMGVKGADLLRDLLIDLMLEECPLPDRGGALHLSRLIRPERMAILLALPYPRPDRAALLASHVALAQAFFPLARTMAQAEGVAWPAPFEAATRRHLEAELGLVI